MDSPKQPLNFKNAVTAVLVFLLVVAAFFGIYRFHHILFILFVAIVLGTVARPAYEWLKNRGIHKNLASAIILIVLLALIAGFFMLLLPMLTSQYQTLLSAIPRYYGLVREWVASSRNELVARLSEMLPAELLLGEQLPNANQDATTTLNGAMNFIGTSLNSIFVAIVLVLLSHQWMVSGPQIVASSLFFVKPEKRQNILDIVQQIETKVSQYLVGQGLLCLSIAGLSLVAYLLLGLPNALLLALIAGVFEAVPMVGPVLGAIPAILVALSMSPSTLIWVIVAAVVIQQLENNLLVPRIMDRVVGVNPFISILSITTFSSLYGIGGALMAIPLAAVIQLIFERSLMERDNEMIALDASRDKLNLLRYEVQDFITGMQNQARQAQPGDTENRTKIDSVMEEMEMVARDLDALLADRSRGGA